MTYETILYDLAGSGVATVTLNRPDRLNATDDTLFTELSTLIRHMRDDSGVRAVILTGAGRGFCAGADVKAMNPDTALLDRRARHRWVLRDVLRPLIELEKPVIAAVNGPAVGAGFNIALACDVIVASDAAMFSQIFARLGLVPDLGGFHLLTRVVGLNKAKELCFTARKLSAREGLELGFVNHLVPAADLMARAGALAEEMAAGPATAISMMKMLLNKSSNTTLDQMLDYESYAQTLAYTTPDHTEGIAAFREKREPDFRKRDK